MTPGTFALIVRAAMSLMVTASAVIFAVLAVRFVRQSHLLCYVFCNSYLLTEIKYRQVARIGFGILSQPAALLYVLSRHG